MSSKKEKSKLTYAESGVDIEAGEQAVNNIKKLASATFNSQVLTGLGSFGGFFKPDMTGIENPVFISSTDSVGTKVKLAFMTGIHNTVGQDLVNHCINDILVHGARGLFFLDYIAVEKLYPDVIEKIVEGLSTACRENSVSLIGGETAELPDFYQPGEYDLVGFVVGMVDENKIINGSKIEEGDICLGLASNGLHTNGYSLARKAAFEIGGHKPDDFIEEMNMTVAEALMKVHRSYATQILPLLDKFKINGMAHITGGGIPGNLKRVLPENLSAKIDKSTWPKLPVFKFLEQAGNIDRDNMYSAFNMGIGYILVVNPNQVEGITQALEETGEKVYKIGTIEKGDGLVTLV